MSGFRSNRQLGRIATLMMLATMASAQQGQNGSIRGTVLQDNGSTLPGAVVSAQLMRISAQTAPFLATGTTGQDGTFTITNLPFGTYQICVRPNKPALLNPCDWTVTASGPKGGSSPIATATTPPPVNATVSSAAGAVLAPIQLAKGRSLRVHLSDPQGLLAATEGKTPGAHVLVGLWLRSGLFLPMPVVSNGANSRDHQIEIPENAEVYFSIQSSAFTLTDGTGNPVDPNKGTSMIIPAGTGAAPALNFTVTGRQAGR